MESHGEIVKCNFQRERIALTVLKLGVLSQ